MITTRIRQETGLPEARDHYKNAKRNARWQARHGSADGAGFALTAIAEALLGLLALRIEEVDPT